MPVLSPSCTSVSATPSALVTAMGVRIFALVLAPSLVESRSKFTGMPVAGDPSGFTSLTESGSTVTDPVRYCRSSPSIRMPVMKRSVMLLPG